MPPKRQGKYLIKPKTKKRKTYTAAQVKSYVNKTLFLRPSLFERKWYQIGFTGQLGLFGSNYALNPFLFLGQGTSQDARIGLNISNVNIYFDVQYCHQGLNVGGAQPYSDSRIRCLLFTNSTKWHNTVVNTMDLNTGGIGTVIPVTDVYLDSGLDRMTHSYLNKDINKILYDSGPKVASSGFNPGNANGKIVTQRFNVKLGDLRFESNSTSYLRDNQVYFWVVCDTTASTVTAANDVMGKFSVNMLVTFQDS